MRKNKILFLLAILFAALSLTACKVNLPGITDDGQVDNDQNGDVSTDDDNDNQDGNDDSGEHVHEYTWTVKQSVKCNVDGIEEGVCECGETTTRTIKSEGHKFVVDEAVEATCENTGLTEGKHCEKCGFVEVEQQIIPEAHEAVVDEAVEPTCTEAGKTEGSHCGLCGDVLVAQKEVPASHTEEEIPGKDATCSEPGLTAGVKCSVCGEILEAQEEIPTLDHTEEEIPGKDATCTSTGLTAGKKCSVCGEILEAQEEISMAEHTLSSVDAKDSTCSEAGNIAHNHCSVCNQNFDADGNVIANVELPTLDHTNVANYATGKYECSECGTVGEGLKASAYQLMGTVTDWNSGKVMYETENSDVICVAVELAAKEYEYKIRKDNAWTVSYGASVAQKNQFVAVLNGPSGAPNTVLKITEAGLYYFYFNTKTKVACIIMENAAAESYTFSVIGEFTNNWATDAEIAMTYQGEGCWSTDVFLKAGSYDYKVRQNNGWEVSYGANFGSSDAVLNAEKTGTYRFTIDFVKGVFSAELIEEHVCKDEDAVEIPAVDATCTSTGLTAGTKCGLCGEILVAQEEVPTIDHDITSSYYEIQDGVLMLVGVCSRGHNVASEADVTNPIEVSNAADLTTVLGFGASVVLTEDITINEIIIIAEGAEVVVDLNGNTLNTSLVKESTTNHAYAFENHGTLVITGNGVINARGIFNYGDLTLENGTINAIDGNGGYGVRNYAGSFTMNGGTIATTLEDDNKVDEGGYDATAVRVDKGASFVMNAGELVNICDYTFAIDNYGDVTINGGSVTSVHSTISSYGNLTVNGGSFVCNGIEGITAHILVAWEGSTTEINAGTFDGKDNYNGFNVDACEGSIVNINGGNFLAVHSGSLYGKGTINVMGGTFFDNPSARVIDGYDVNEKDGVYVVVKHEHKAFKEYLEVQEGQLYSVVVCACGHIEYNEYDETPLNVSTPEDLKLALEFGASVVLNASVDLPKAIVVSKDAELTIAKGVEITATNEPKGDGVFHVTNGATLTINGEGTVNGVGNNDYSLAIWADGGHVVINGGTYTNVGATGADDNHFDLIYVKNGGSVTINGGTFIAETPQWTLNLKDGESQGTFVVKGGSFFGYNPANSQTEPAGANNNFVAEGYLSLLNANGYYTVVKQTSIAEALEIGGKKAHNAYTTDKYTLVGTVKNVYNTQYGNMYIKDSEGNEICIYGLYSANGKTRYDAMSYKPVAGDVVVVTGVLGRYNSTIQMKNGWLLECTVHVCTNYKDATCKSPALCTVCGKAKDDILLEHDYVDGLCSVCGAADPNNAGEIKVFTYDLVTNFATYAKDWGTGYTTHTIESSDLGSGLVAATIKISNGNKQQAGNTIDDRPVFCAKNSYQYTTVTLKEGAIKNVTFNIKKWGSKTFQDIHIEYFNGTAWVKCSDVMKDPASGTLTSTVLPEGVTQVRLAIKGNSSNTQLGLTSIEITLA